MPGGGTPVCARGHLCVPGLCMLWVLGGGTSLNKTDKALVEQTHSNRVETDKYVNE